MEGLIGVFFDTCSTDFYPSTGIPLRCHSLKSSVQGSLGGSGFPGGLDTKASTPNIKPAENDSNVEADFLTKTRFTQLGP